MIPDVNRRARSLFAPIAGDYDRWSNLLSFGQDRRWRQKMVDELRLPRGSRVLDVAAGTGQVATRLRDEQLRVIALDQSPEMLFFTARKAIPAVLGQAEFLPFPDSSFDGLTFTYLLRYVQDPVSCMRELVRVVRHGGSIGMVEFGVPTGIWKPLWTAYTRALLPRVGTVISPGWKDVGHFLEPSIVDFHRKFPGTALVDMWEASGITDVRMGRMSVGGGLIISGRRK